MLRTIKQVDGAMTAAVERGAAVEAVTRSAAVRALARMRDWPVDRCEPEAELALNGLPMNPVARAHPADFIEAGVSALDVLHTLVRG